MTDIPKWLETLVAESAPTSLSLEGDALIRRLRDDTEHQFWAGWTRQLIDELTDEEYADLLRQYDELTALTDEEFRRSG